MKSRGALSASWSHLAIWWLVIHSALAREANPIFLVDVNPVAASNMVCKDKGGGLLLLFCLYRMMPSWSDFFINSTVRRTFHGLAWYGDTMRTTAPPSFHSCGFFWWRDVFSLVTSTKESPNINRGDKKILFNWSLDRAASLLGQQHHLLLPLMRVLFGGVDVFGLCRDMWSMVSNDTNDFSLAYFRGNKILLQIRNATTILTNMTPAINFSGFAPGPLWQVKNNRQMSY